ncbi:MAG: DedA family protein [Erythrobacter sp.]|jgi:membrane protein DedA with SNARE-associated domain|nr:DedA family protein [Erythrobacter sp.]
MTEFILDVIRWGGYLGIFILMALENVFPPVPSEIIMGAGGVLVARGEMTFWPLLLIGTAGTLVGNLFWYWLGRRWREAQLRYFIARYGRWLTFEWRTFVRARKTFRRYGDGIIFLFRFSPVLRTIVSLPAGLARMKLWRFCLFTFLGSLVWNGALILGGRALSGFIAQYEEIVGLAIAAMVVLGIGYYIYRVVTWRPDRSEDA